MRNVPQSHTFLPTVNQFPTLSFVDKQDKAARGTIAKSAAGASNEPERAGAAVAPRVRRAASESDGASADDSDHCPVLDMLGLVESAKPGLESERKVTMTLLAVQTMLETRRIPALYLFLLQYHLLGLFYVSIIHPLYPS